MAIQTRATQVRLERVVTNTEPVGTTSWTLTTLRLPIALALPLTIHNDQRNASLALLVAFVALDIADGAVARSRDGGDNRLRRAADSVIDRTTVAIAMICAGVHEPALMTAGILCGVASVLAAPRAIHTYSSRHATLRAPMWHRTWSLGYAFAGAAWAIGHTATATIASVAATMIMCGCTALMARDHRRLRDLGP